MAFTQNSLKYQINKLKLKEARLEKDGNFKRMAKVRKVKEEIVEKLEEREKDLADIARLGYN